MASPPRSEPSAERPGRAVRGRDPDQHRLQRPRRAGRPGAGAERHHHPHPRRAAGPAGGGLLAFVRERSGRSGSWTTGAASWSRRLQEAGPSSTPNSPESGGAAPTSSATCKASGTCTPQWQASGRAGQRILRRSRNRRRGRQGRWPHPSGPDLLWSLHNRYDKAVTWESSPADTATTERRQEPPRPCPGPPIAGQSRPDLALDHPSPCPGQQRQRTRTEEPKLHQKMPRATGTPATAALLPGPLLPHASRNHGVRPIDAIHQALTGTGHHRQRPDHGFTP